MKLRITSDIHSEFYQLGQIPKLTEDSLPYMDEDDQSILIIAGDLGSMHKPDNIRKFIDIVAPRFKSIIYTPGNHEYYGGDIFQSHTDIMDIISSHDNVYFSPNGIFQDVERNIFYCTLWTDFDNENPVTMYMASKSMNDYRHICHGGRRVRVEDILSIHRECVAALNKAKTGDIIITHHLPSFKSVAPEYHGSDMNGAYASDLDKLILEKKPALMIHGHTHISCDYKIGDTRIVCNPRGYIGGLNPKYNPKLLIEV